MPATEPMDGLAEVSKGGALLRIMGLPVPGGIVAVHLFATDDGFAFVDGNWLDPVPAGHVGHHVVGEVIAAGEAVVFQTEDGEPLTFEALAERSPEAAQVRAHLEARGRSWEQDRELAASYLEQSLSL